MEKFLKTIKVVQWILIPPVLLMSMTFLIAVIACDQDEIVGVVSTWVVPSALGVVFLSCASYLRNVVEMTIEDCKCSSDLQNGKSEQA